MPVMRTLDMCQTRHASAWERTKSKLCTSLPTLEGQVSVIISSRNRVAQLFPGHWVTFKSSLTTGKATEEVFETSPYIYILHEMDGPVQSQSDVTTDSQSVSMSRCLVHAAVEGLHPNEFQEGYDKEKF
jgi:hypothetical protein